METGSYIGTGTYGAGHPVSITLTHHPKFVIVVANLSSTPGTGVGYGGYGVFFCTGMVKSYSASNSLIVALPNYDPDSKAMVSLDNNVLSWYLIGNSPVLNSKYMLYTYYSFY